MTDKELKKMTRKELLELLIEQARENSDLKEKLAQAEIELLEKKLIVDKCGTMSEAAMVMNGVFEAADAAAKQYLENLRRMSEQLTAETAKLQAEKTADESPATGEQNDSQDAGTI